jgi:hypothetical protein
MFKERDHGSIMANIPNDNDPAGKALLDFIRKHSGSK